jgi:predicted CXXCH cytochrome family protein
MKKTVSILAAVAVVAGASMAFAKAGDSNIANSLHNIPSKFGDKVNNTSQICVYCHTPHNAKMALPLWNRNASAKADSSFTLYSSQTMASAVRKTGFTSDSMSLFCMSCHDGSPLGGSMIQNGPKDAPAWSGAITANSANFKQDLSKTHPVNFTLRVNNTGKTATSSSAGQLRADGESDLVWNGSAAYMGLNPGGTFPLFKSTRGDFSVECSSCHAVHDDYYAPFLRSTMGGSALCLGCHRK